MSKFKAGDRAIFQGQVTGGINYPNQVEVTVIHAESGHSIYCQFPDGKKWYVSERELLSTQSPQPQTTKPKEDNMFAVLSYNFATGNHAVTTYPTADEAKEKAGMTVAKNRASLTEKTFFSMTIVDLKTGKLVGSVVDAPPAVEWKTE